MLINGEKFACEACVRGHRVSSCQHQDRLLIHVNKKGRPISQCHHCRGLRKARASHVKCECAEKAHSKEDCPHEKGEKSENSTCCCGHGARCNCSIKKEHLDTVPEDYSQIIHPTLHPKEPHKPRHNNLISHESKTTVFQNGHHKPVHKINDAHNHCGAPYRVPHKSHPLPAPREIAQRSSDSLPLTKSTMSHEASPLHESVTSAPQPLRKVKSEHNSPEMKPLPDLSINQNRMVIPPLDPNAYGYSPFDSNSNNSPSIPQNPTQNPAPEYQFPERFPDHLFMSYDQAHDYEPPFPSGGLSEGLPEIDWSTYNFQNANNVYNVNNSNNNNNGYVPSQPPSYASFEQLSHLSHPGLTSSSGDISEAEDYTHVKKPSTARADSHDNANDFSSIAGDETSEAYRLSSASSYIGLPQTQMLAGANIESLDIDDYLEQAKIESQQMRIRQQLTPPYQQSSQSPGTSSQQRNFSQSSQIATGEHPFTVEEAQMYAHMGNQQEPVKAAAMLPTTLGGEDPMLSSYENANLNLDFENDDDDWVR